MKLVIIIFWIGVSFPLFSQEPFFRLAYSIKDCNACTVQPFGPWSQKSIFSDAAERIEILEPDFIKADSIYTSFIDQPPNDISFQIVNHITNDTMYFEVKDIYCLNSSVNILNIPFQRGHFEPKFTGYCSLYVDPDYEWTPVKQ